MRTIKFRGKRIDTGEWVYGSLLQSEIDVNQLNVQCEIHERFAHDFSIVKYSVIPESVGQFTGLVDKNGAEIYEGDLLRDGSIKYPYVYEVYWSAQFQWGMRYNNQFMGCLSDNEFIVPEEMKVTVIGNIHDDNSLLNSEQSLS